MLKYSNKTSQLSSIIWFCEHSFEHMYNRLNFWALLKSICIIHNFQSIIGSSLVKIACKIYIYILLPCRNIVLLMPVYRARGFIYDTLFSRISRKLLDSWKFNLWTATSQVKCIISYWNKEGSSWKWIISLQPIRENKSSWKIPRVRYAFGAHMQGTFHLTFHILTYYM